MRWNGVPIGRVSGIPPALCAILLEHAKVHVEYCVEAPGMVMILALSMLILSSMKVLASEQPIEILQSQRVRTRILILVSAV
jgi:hypothetical protein